MANLHETTDAAVRRAIAQYEADVRAGVIVFGPEGFADTYPGKDQSEAQLARFVRRHVREP